MFGWLKKKQKLDEEYCPSIVHAPLHSQEWVVPKKVISEPVLSLIESLKNDEWATEVRIVRNSFADNSECFHHKVNKELKLHYYGYRDNRDKVRYYLRHIIWMTNDEIIAVSNELTLAVCREKEKLEVDMKAAAREKFMVLV